MFVHRDVIGGSCCCASGRRPFVARAAEALGRVLVPCVCQGCAGPILVSSHFSDVVLEDSINGTVIMNDVISLRCSANYSFE
jgi:hypothetical protein